MVKKRVFELARELGVESKSLISKFNELGIEVKNHMSTVSETEIAKILPNLKAGLKPQQRGTGPREAAGQSKPPKKELPQKQHPTTDEGPKQVRQDRRGDQPTVTPRSREIEEKQPEESPRSGRPESMPGDAGRRQERGSRPPRPVGPRGEGAPRPPRPVGPRGEGAPRPPRPVGPRGEGAPRSPRPGGGRWDGPRPSHPVGPRGEGAPRPPRPDGTRFDRPRYPRPDGGGRSDSARSMRPDSPGGMAYGGRRPEGGARPQGFGARPIPKSAIPKPPDTGEPPKKDGRQRHANHKLQGPKDRDRRYNDRPGAKIFPRRPRKAKKNVRSVEAETPKHIVIDEFVTVMELSQAMGKPVTEIIKKLMQLGVLATINQEIDADTATIMASEWGITAEVRKAVTAVSLLEEEPEEAEENLLPRPPVVTVMGHVDHGKTSLLDAIRQTNVIASEAGGITQHIGAYQVEIRGKKITFLDTPGHEAFTAMRARGAQVTDVAILVVAADDGVMPQTVEAINHVKAAKVPIIVAINKIDKPGASSERVKQELTEHGLVIEEWGGDTIAVPVSAKTRKNIDQLLEMVLLVAEVQDLKANPDRLARGTVVEAELDKGRGPVATVLVQRGTLQVGDVIIAGMATGKVRAMIDDKGRRIKKAGPSTPVEVLGLSDLPLAGDNFAIVSDEKLVKQVVAERVAKRKEEEQKLTAKVSLDDLFKQIKEGKVKELNVIIKADVQGSVEAIQSSLERLSTDEVRVNVVHGGVGAITETDIMLAAASNAIVIGFNVRPDTNSRKAAELQQIDVRLYRVIYDAIEDIKAALSGLLEPEKKEVVLGRAEVRATFKVPKAGIVAGCYLTEGKITRNSSVRVIRDGVVIHEGSLESLKRFKDDAKEVLEGFECGVGIAKFNDIKEKDIIEAFVIEEIKRQI